MGDQHRSRLTAGRIMMMLAIRMRRRAMSVFTLPVETIAEPTDDVNPTQLWV